MKLSQCMIVKNEEKNIERALSWGKGIVCEQIVVDTGSTDGTMEIAKKMGAKVYEFPWINDFAAAKNFALSKAMGDWIAFLDADEYFSEEDAKKLLPLLETLEKKRFEKNGKKEKINVIETDCVQLDTEGKVYGVLEQIRIFRNKPYIRYQGAIHEQIASRSEVQGLTILDMRGKLAIYHTGYAWTSKEEMQKKGERNITLLERELKQNPHSAMLKLYIAESLLLKDESIKAISFAKQAIQNEDKSLSTEKLIDGYQLILYELYSLKSKNRTLPEDEKFDIENFYQEAVKIAPNYPDFDIALGMIYFFDKDWKKTSIYLEQGLEKSSQMKNVLHTRIVQYLKDIYRMLTISYGFLNQWDKIVYYSTAFLGLEKFEEFMLTLVLRKFSAEENITSKEIMNYLNKIYDFKQKKDLFFVLKCVKKNGIKDLEELLKEYLTLEDRDILYPSFHKIIEKDLSQMTGVDHDFYMLFERILNISEENLVWVMRENLEKIRQKTPQIFQSVVTNYNYWNYWGKIDLENGNLELIQNRVKELKEHGSDLIWFYEKLEDFRSKKVLYYLIQNWLTFRPDFLERSIEKVYDQYFDMDIVLCDKKEVIVDLGAFIGDTYDAYIKTYGEENYQKYYCYEISDENLEKLREKFSGKETVILRDKAAAEKSGKSKIVVNNDFPGANFIGDKGEKEIETVSIDEDILEKITLLKMDIEGAEQKAIEGSKRHIKEEKPKLTISIYHKNEDLWKIPKMIYEINPEYKFYLRYYGGNIYPSEYILIAI